MFVFQKSFEKVGCLFCFSFGAELLHCGGVLEIIKFSLLAMTSDSDVAANIGCHCVTQRKKIKPFSVFLATI